ncbi:MAG: replicative DNA helicase [Acholeplasmataceae bacterium]
MTQRVMPHNLEAEQSLLGAIFLDPTLLPQVADKITIEDFYETRHQSIYQAFLQLLDKGEKVDYTTVSKELASFNMMGKVGGDYLSDLTDFTPTLAHIETYIDYVLDASLKRMIIQSMGDIYARGFDPSISTNDYVDHAEEEIFRLSRRRRAGELLKIGPVLEDVRRKAEVRRSEGDITGLNLGYSRLNYYTSGFQPEELIILAARPAVGKSAFAMNLALHACKYNKNGKAGVVFFSLEMSNEQLVQRMLSCQSMVNNRNIRTGNLTPNDWKLIDAASMGLDAYNIYFDDTSTVKVNEIRAKCRRLQQEGKLDFVIVDYLQLIEPSKDRANRQEMISEISRGLKLMARELKVPVLALSQLSRDIEKRNDKTPVLADLRESGAIEQDADIVMFMYALEGLEDTIEVSIAKNRSGQTGRIQLKFQKEYSRFIQISEREED